MIGTHNSPILDGVKSIIFIPCSLSTWLFKIAEKAFVQSKTTSQYFLFLTKKFIPSSEVLMLCFLASFMPSESLFLPEKIDNCMKLHLSILNNKYLNKIR
jgi:hypothetical protein